MEMDEGLVVRGRVEIDMRRPFKSVKEAVMLFGEKVLAGEVYSGQKLKQTVEGENNHQYRTKVGAIAAELEETKYTLEKAKDEVTCMAYCLASLKQELEETKSELNQLKLTKEIKSIENPIWVDVNHPEIQESDDENYRFEKKRSVKFASPPSLTKVMVEARVTMHETSPKKKAQSKTLIPSLSGIFSRKKSGPSSRSPKSLN